MKESNQIGVDSLKTVTESQLVSVQRVESSDYSLAHSKDMTFFYGGVINEEGIESVQVMADGDIAHFDPETLEFEYLSP